MLNKDTVVFITDTDKTAVAEVLKKELTKDNSHIGIIVRERELESALYRFATDVLNSRKLNFGYRINNFLQRHKPAPDVKKKSKKKINALKERSVCNLCYRFTPCAVVTNSENALPSLVRAVNKVGMNTQIFVYSDEYTFDESLIASDVKHYFVDNIGERDFLLSRGIFADKIDVNPIPIDAAFFEEYDAAKAKQKLGFEPTARIALICASFEGDDNFRAVMDYAASSDRDFIFAAACGRNRMLFDYAAERKIAAYNESADIRNLIAASDVIVCRPTAIFLKQAAAMKKPVVAMFPLGVRERADTGYLLADGRIAEAKSVEELDSKLTEFFTGGLNRVFDDCDRYSAMKIVDKIKELIVASK